MQIIALIQSQRILICSICDCIPEISFCTHCAASLWSHNIFAQDFVLRVSSLPQWDNDDKGRQINVNILFKKNKKKKNTSINKITSSVQYW